MSEPRPADSPAAGSADEVHALLTALTEWAQRAMPAPPSGHSGPECQWCPLCQLASVLRGEHPELTERLAEAAAALTGAVRSLLDARGEQPSAAAAARPGAQSDEQPNAASQPRRPRPRVERVVLDDESGRA